MLEIKTTNPPQALQYLGLKMTADEVDYMLAAVKHVRTPTDAIECPWHAAPHFRDVILLFHTLAWKD